MPKRIFNVSENANKILDFRKKLGCNLSAYTSNAIVDTVLPMYGTLRIEALFLLGSVSNGLEDWTGPDGSRVVPEDPEVAALTAIRRTFSWLRDNHIKNNSAIAAALGHFETSAAGVHIEDIPEYRRERLIVFNDRMKALGLPSEGIRVSLGSMGLDILKGWDLLFDDPGAYEALIDIVYLEKIRRPFKPFEALEFMRTIENAFILEHICM